jgi:cysteine desulfuration protein SufE
MAMSGTQPAAHAPAPALPGFDEIVANFELIDGWDERYRYLIELGRALPPLSDAQRVDANKVPGCASQVWLVTEPVEGGRLAFRGDSDAHIVKGLVALLVSLFSGRAPEAILSIDPQARFQEIGLSQHLTPQRSNGVRAMVERIRAEARRGLPQAG